MKHKHYDLIVQWADDPEGWEVWYIDPHSNGTWVLTKVPGWIEGYDYELVPKAKAEWAAVERVHASLCVHVWSGYRDSHPDYIGHFRRDNPDATPVFVPVGDE